MCQSCRAFFRRSEILLSIIYLYGKKYIFISDVSGAMHIQSSNAVKSAMLQSQTERNVELVDGPSA